MNLAFFSKISKGKKHITNDQICKIIQSRGLCLEDVRIKEALDRFKEKEQVDLAAFSAALEKNDLLHRIFSHDLVVPEWDEFVDEITLIFKRCEKLNEGKKSVITPSIEFADDSDFGVSVCTIDGQRLDLGDTDVDFCSQSCSNVISYLLAVHHQGSDFVHKNVGKEACGETNRNLNLKEIKSEDDKIKYIPHNPFSDAGAILCCSLIDNYSSEPERLRRIKEVINNATDSSIKISHEAFLYERDMSDRRACMAYMMRECKSFPKDTSISKSLELYSQLLSIQFNTKQMAVLAATLANGGVCPLNKKAVFKMSDVRDCLSLMLSCGLYDFSGEWAFKIGLPAKSSISGCIFIVIPNRMGIAIYSPKLDVTNNSIKAIRFAELLVEQFSFHHLESNRSFGESVKIMPCTVPATIPKKKEMRRIESFGNLSSLMSASDVGDTDGIRDLVAESADLMLKNYDKRTALHLAAAKDHVEVIELLVNRYNGQKRHWKELSQTDRWGLTPLDLAYRKKALRSIEILEKCGAKRGSELKKNGEVLDKNDLN